MDGNAPAPAAPTLAAPAAPRHATLVIGLAVAAVGLATTLPLPLYGAFATASGGGAGGLSLAFACYAATVMLSAPLLGPLPDRIGRRPCVLLGIVFAALSTLVLSLAPGLPGLALARTAQGIAMGCVAGAAAAWAAELGGGGAAGGARAARVIAAATIGSFATGGLLTLLAQLARPLDYPPLTFGLHLGFALLLLVLVARLPETRRPGAAPRGPWLRRPAFPAGTWPTTLAILPGWGTTGTVMTSVPAVLAAAGLPRAGTAAACAMMALGALAQFALHRMAPRRAVALGLAMLVLAAALAFCGTWLRSPWLLLPGGAAVGIAVYAFIYLGGLGAASAAASGEERARAVAGYFVVAHLGFGAGPLAVGLAVDAVGTGPALLAAWLAILLSAAALLPRLREGGGTGRRATARSG